MSIEHHRCYTLVCDDCARVYDETGTDGYIVHFDTVDTAMDHATQDGWQVTETGDIHCFHCAARRLCAHDGHQFTPWIPCMCRGRIPDHALFGCGLFRLCHRPGCDLTETASLTQLPTLEHPITGR